eukprot:520260_1
MINMNNTSRHWLQTAKNQLKETTIAHMKQRMIVIENIVNERLPSNSTRFIIDDKLKKEIINETVYIIEEWRGTKKLINNLEKSQQDVIKKTRTWWNRTKAPHLGEILFAPICFFALYNFIQENCKSLSGAEQLILFIDIFDGFMCYLIKFRKTKGKSLILHQCFTADGKYKDTCAQFLQIFGDNNIQWNPYIKRTTVDIKDGKKIFTYNKHKNLSQNLFTTFQQCLQQIKTKFMNVSQNMPITQLNRWNFNMDNMNNSEISMQQMQCIDANTDQQIWNNSTNNYESTNSDVVETQCIQGQQTQDTIQTCNTLTEENITLSSTCTIRVDYGPIHEQSNKQFHRTFHPYYREEKSQLHVNNLLPNNECIQYDECCNIRNECASPFIANNYYEYTSFDEDMDIIDKYNHINQDTNALI